MVDSVAISIAPVEPVGDWLSLKASIAAWLNRDDLTSSQLTEFIALAEARFNRVLRHPEMERVVTTNLTAGNNALPSDFLAMKALYRGTYPLDAMTPTGLVEEYGSTTGPPSAYALIGGNPRKIRLGPQPALDGSEYETFPVTMVYYAKIVGVDENNADNWLLNEHPDLYLWGCMLSAEAFLANDSRLGIWKAAYDEALAELMAAGDRDRFGTGPIVTPAPVRAVSGVRA